MDDQFREYLFQGQQVGLRYALVPPRNAPWGLAGTQLAKRAGSSLEFMDHREYQPGDDLRRIDWSAYARTDRLTIKLFREEVNPHLDLVLDGSRSMALAGTAKAQAALGLSAVLAQAADNAGFTCCPWLTGEGCRQIENGADRPAGWEGVEFAAAANPSEAFSRLPPTLRPQAICVLVSDLLWPADPLGVLSRLAERSAAVYVVQVLARDDVDPPERGNLRLVDSETARVQEVFLDAPAQQRYRDALARHQQNWNRACIQTGARMTTLVAERVVEEWNLNELVAAEILRVV